MCPAFSLLLDFEKLCHVGEVLLISLSHLLLCSPRIHNLQTLREEGDDDDGFNNNTAKGTAQLCNADHFHLKRVVIEETPSLRTLVRKAESATLNAVCDSDNGLHEDRSRSGHQ